MRPSWPAASDCSRKRSASSASARDHARQERAAADDRGQPLDARRRRATRSASPRPRGRGSRRRTTTALRLRAAAATSRLRPQPAHRDLEGLRPAVGRAAPPPRPPPPAPAAPRARAQSTTSGTRSVTSWSCRVKTRTSSPALWTWMRAPSTLYSKAASPRRSRASPTSSAVLASIGATGDRRRMREARQGRRRLRRAPRAPPRPRLAANMAAWRTSRGRQDAARAIASCTRPSRAPWRTSPISSSTRKRRPGSSARSMQAAQRAHPALGGARPASPRRPRPAPRPRRPG